MWRQVLRELQAAGTFDTSELAVGAQLAHTGVVHPHAREP